MPKITPDAEESLRKLGQRLREGWAKEHPVPAKSLQAVKEAVRDQWEQEQETKKVKEPEPDVPPPAPDREAEEPER